MAACGGLKCVGVILEWEYVFKFMGQGQICARDSFFARG
jgi:hypothetical protein